MSQAISCWFFLSTEMIKVNVTNRDGSEVTLEAEEGLSLMEIMRDQELAVEAICGGCASCGTCHIYVDEAWLEIAGPRNEDEHALLEFFEKFDATHSRLSCQIKISGELDGLKLALAPEE